jgi:hypothetical protein
MNMQVLLEKSSILASIFKELLKNQMDRTCEKHAAVAASIQKRPIKTKNQRSGRHVSRRGKHIRDDEGHYGISGILGKPLLRDNRSS